MLLGFCLQFLFHAFVILYHLHTFTRDGHFWWDIKGVQWPLQATFEGTEGRHNVGVVPSGRTFSNSNEKHLKFLTKFRKWDHTQHNSTQGVKEIEVHAIIFTLILLSFKHNCISDYLIYFIHRNNFSSLIWDYNYNSVAYTYYWPKCELDTQLIEFHFGIFIEFFMTKNYSKFNIPCTVSLNIPKSSP
jgi:hypothetical protein